MTWTGCSLVLVLPDAFHRHHSSSVQDDDWLQAGVDSIMSAWFKGQSYRVPVGFMQLLTKFKPSLGNVLHLWMAHLGLGKMKLPLPHSADPNLILFDNQFSSRRFGNFLSTQRKSQSCKVSLLKYKRIHNSLLVAIVSGHHDGAGATSSASTAVLSTSQTNWVDGRRQTGQIHVNNS